MENGWLKSGGFNWGGNLLKVSRQAFAIHFGELVKEQAKIKLVTTWHDLKPGNLGAQTHGFLASPKIHLQ